MYSFHAFGGACIEDESGPLSGPVAQRRRLALLALLAASPIGRMSRDKLTSYLWPETDTEHARDRLIDAVHALRKALGKDALLSVGDELRLNPERVRSDVGEFGVAVTEQQWERSVGLYSGPFLDGFFVPNAPEFERWAEAERERLSRDYARALEALAEERESDGGFRSAVEAWRKLAAHDPYSGRVAVRLMRALDMAGDRAGALQHAQVQTALLREEFGVEPEPEVLALAEHLRTQPVQREENATATTLEGASEPAGDPQSGPLAPVMDSGADPSDHTATPHLSEGPQIPGGNIGSAAPVSSQSGRKTHRRYRAVFAAGAALVLLIAIGTWGAAWVGGEIDPTRIQALAVLPLDNLSGDPEQEYFADGMTDALITELARFGEIRVISRTSVMQYKDAPKSLPEIAQELGVDAVVEGTVLRDGDRVRITAQLIRAPADEHLWAESYERELHDVLALQDEIARAVARAVQTQAAEDIPPLSTVTRNVDPRAYALYLKGLHLWNEDAVGNARESIDYFERALAIEPDFALAYAGLGEVYVHLDEWERDPRQEARAEARDNLRRALELDESLAEAHTSLAHLLMHEEQWAAAEREYRRAIELNPSYAYARILFAFHLVALSRFDEAVREARWALELDPLSARTNGFAAYTLYYARRYDEAIEQWRRTLELYPDGIGVYFGIADAYVAKGMPREGLAWAERVLDRASGPGARLSLARVYAAAGRHEQARRLVGEVLHEAEVAQPAGNAELDALAVAQAFSRIGDRENAFLWIDEAIEREHGWTMFLAVEPIYDPLRSDPRFTALLHRMELE